MCESPPSYQDFFKNAVANPSIAPYDWQERLAKIGPCQSLLVDIPTGLGKTAGVVLAWLWNRVVNPTPAHEWPRRLI